MTAGEAAETWGEQSFAYTSGRERLTVNWVRVVRPNGEVVSAKPVHEQESIAAVAHVHTGQPTRIRDYRRKVFGNLPTPQSVDSRIVEIGRIAKRKDGRQDQKNDNRRQPCKS